MPGTVGDPARVAQNTSGVSNNNDQTNNIIVRGNSPRYVQWNINGVEIPNPNHFINSLNGGGGVISMLSTNALADADFMTGAFPAEYGNALSGLFNISLRNGNQSARESTVQLGMLGIEASTEGPFGKNTDKTYLVNYRYANYGFLEKMKLIDGTLVPSFQDLTININLPTKKIGTFTIFSINGKSDVLFSQYGEPNQNAVLLNTSGVQHKYFFNPNSSVETSALYARNDNQFQNGFLTPYSYPEIKKYVLNSLLLSVKYNLKISAKQVIRIGASYKDAEFVNTDLRHTKYKYVYDTSAVRGYAIPFDTTVVSHSNLNGQLVQGFISYKLKLQNLTINLGVHATYFNIAKEIVAEPRLGINYFVGRSTLSFGAGLHSFVEELSVYQRFKNKYSDSLSTINGPLKTTKSWHIVASYTFRINEFCQIKIEPYFQYLFDVPARTDLKYSLLNYETIHNDPNTFFTNAGRGKNYGIELSFERTFNNNYFFNVYASRYESKSIMNNVVTNSTYNGQYSAVGICGKEFAFKKYRKIGINISVKCYGGTYIDKYFTASTYEQAAYYLSNPTYEKLNDYFRLDTQIFYSQSKKHFSYKLSLDINNLTNRLNELSRYYDYSEQRVRSTYQLGLIPILSYKVNF